MGLRVRTSQPRPRTESQRRPSWLRFSQRSTGEARPGRVGASADPAGPGGHVAPSLMTVGVSALVTAAVTVAATAVFTSAGSWLTSNVRDAFGWSTKEPSSTPSGQPSGRMKRIADPSNALALTVPEDWGFMTAAQDTPFGAESMDRPGRTDYAGTAFVAGTSGGMTNSRDLSEPDIYFTASREAARDLGLVGAPPETLQAWARDLVRVDDWTIDSCVLVREEAPHVTGYVTSGRLWRDCDGLKGTQRWDVAAASDDGGVLVLLQLQFTDELPMATARTIMSSFTAAPEKIPDGRRPHAPTSPAG